MPDAIRRRQPAPTSCSAACRPLEPVSSAADDNATHQVGQRCRSLGPEPFATLARRLRRSRCDLSGIVIGSDVAAAPGQTSQGDERRAFVVTVKNV